MMYRPIEERDRDSIRAALEKALKVIRRRGKLYLNNEDWDVGMEYIMSTPTACIFREQYLVMASLGSNWFSTATILQEELVLRVYPGDAQYSDVVTFLETLAKDNNATAVVIGTAGFTDKSPVHELLKHDLGFKQESIQYIKEVQ